MNFHDFQQFRSELLMRDASFVDLAETNIWRSLNHLIPLVQLRPDIHIHRCHLAEVWLDVFELPSTWSKYTMITSGVRHSLSLLLPELAKRNGQLVMPLDVYPVYGQIADASGLVPALFPTVPELQIPDHGDWLLLPNPLKPAGRWLTLAEVRAIKDWLAQSPLRRILIDAVYSFGTQIHSTTLALLETQQAFLMHSLSKAWLHPKVMGVCIVPEADWVHLAAIFRCNSPVQADLQTANVLLRSHQDVPFSVDYELTLRRVRLRARLPLGVETLQTDSQEAGYFIPLIASFESLLESHQILTMPISIFGSTRSDLSVASAL